MALGMVGCVNYTCVRPRCPVRIRGIRSYKWLSDRSISKEWRDQLGSWCFLTVTLEDRRYHRTPTEYHNGQYR